MAFRPPDPFRCEVRTNGDTATVHAAGELDLDTVDHVRRALTELRHASRERVVLDLHELTFIDSTGLRLVIEWDAAARSDGFEFAVIPGDGPVRRLFELSGMDVHVAQIEP